MPQEGGRSRDPGILPEIAFEISPASVSQNLRWAAWRALRQAGRWCILMGMKNYSLQLENIVAGVYQRPSFPGGATQLLCAVPKAYYRTAAGKTMCGGSGSTYEFAATVSWMWRQPSRRGVI